MSKLLTNEEIKELTRSAFNHIDALNAGIKWRTCVPAREDDSDVIISNALHNIKLLMSENEKLQTQLDESRAEGQRLRERVVAVEGTIITLRKALEDAIEEMGVIDPDPTQACIALESMREIGVVADTEEATDDAK